MSQTDIIHNKKTFSSSESINPNKFYEWSKNFQYISSYSSNSSDKPNEPKSDVVQGYAGFMPQIKSNNMFGQTFTKSARQVLASNFSDNPYKLSSTGLNSLRHNYIDKSLNAFTHKFGGTTIQNNHPSLSSNLKESLYKQQFKQPVFSNQNDQDFNINDLNGKNNLSKKTILSGFLKNNSAIGIYSQIGEQKDVKSEYSDRFKSGDRIHRDVTIFHIRNKSQVIHA